MRKIDNIMFVLIAVLGTILMFLLFLFNMSRTPVTLVMRGSIIMCGFGFLIYKGILMLISLL